MWLLSIKASAAPRALTSPLHASHQQPVVHSIPSPPVRRRPPTTPLRSPPTMALASRAAAAVACVLLALAASAAAAGSHHSAPAPAPAINCVDAATGLSDCLEYVMPGGTGRPSAACCGEVKTAVANPAIVACLCSLAGNKDLGIQIDMKRVLALPGACGASNAAFSKCNISTLSPAGAPAPSAGPGGSSSGGAVASPPKAAAAGSPMTATALVAAVAAPLLAYCYLF